MSKKNNAAKNQPAPVSPAPVAEASASDPLPPVQKPARKVYGKAALARLVQPVTTTTKSVDGDGNAIEIPSTYFAAKYAGKTVTGTSKKAVVAKLAEIHAEVKPQRARGPVTDADLAMRCHRALAGLTAAGKPEYKQVIAALEHVMKGLPKPKWNTYKPKAQAAATEQGEGK